MSCEIEYNKQKKDIKGGNKKKLISNLQKRKKNCDDSTIEVKTWNSLYNNELSERINKIDVSAIEDKKLVNLIRTLKQKSFYRDPQQIKNYVTQELVFEVFKKIDIYDEIVEGKDYISIINNLRRSHSMKMN